MASAELQPIILNESDFDLGTSAYKNWQEEPSDEDYKELGYCDTNTYPGQTLEEAIEDFAQFYPTNLVKAWVKKEVAWGTLSIEKAYDLMAESHFVQYATQQEDRFKGVRIDIEKHRETLRLLAGYEVLSDALDISSLPTQEEHWEVKTDKLE